MMKSFVSNLVALGCLSAVTVLAGCGDDSEDTNGTGGGAGASTGGSSSGSGGKASGGASSGGASSGGASSGGASSGGTGGSTGGASSGGTGGGSGGTGGLMTFDGCADAQAEADARSTELGCTGDTAVVGTLCNVILSGAPDCEDELDAVNTCSAAEPSESFECDPLFGIPGPVDGVCAEESTAFDTCTGT